jgi:TonB family protein
MLAQITGGNDPVRITSLAACVALLLTHGVATAAPAAPLLTPTGPWNVEFADSMCLLSRPFGTTTLFLKPGMLGSSLEIIVTQPATSIADPVGGKAVIGVAGSPPVAESYFTAYSTARMRLLRINLRDDSLALSGVRGSLAIEAQPESEHLFSVAGIERALPVLTTCVDQLRTLYKVGQADLAAIATKPKADLKNYFSSADYPEEALNKRQFGTVGVLLWVEADGRISTCEKIESSASLILERATCNILKRRARFAPALDAAGTAVRFPIFSRIRWELPLPGRLPSSSRSSLRP